MLRCIEFRRKMAFRQSHADRIGNALPQGARCCFNARRVLIFGVAGRQGFMLTEILQVLNFQAISKYMQQRIQQCGTMPRRKYKSVPVVPVRIFGICFHFLRPKRVSRRSRAKRQAGMPAVCFLDCLRRKETKGIDGKHINFIHVFTSGMVYFLGTLSQSFRNFSMPISVSGCFAI